MKRRTSEDVKKMYAEDPVLSAVHRILWEDWNPIRVEGLPEDEYITYEKEIIRLIAKMRLTKNDVIKYLLLSSYGMFHDEEETLRYGAKLQEEPILKEDAERLTQIVNKLFSLFPNF